MIGLSDILSAQALPDVMQAYLSRDPDIGFNFMVQVDGIPVGDFVAVETLESKVEPYKYTELGKNDHVHELIGQRSHGHVVLRWGLMNRSYLYEWFREVGLKGEAETSMLSSGMRKTVIITQFTRGKMPVRFYTFSGAFPVRWTGASLDSSNSATALEEVELAFKSMTMTAVPLPF